MKNKSENKEVLIYLSIMFLLGIIYYIPRLFRADFPYCYPEDAEFHLNRLIGLENVWTSPVNLNVGMRFGTMVNVFYPWITMYPMWIIYKICGRLIVAFNIYTVILTIATLYIAFFCFRKICNDNMNSFVCAVVYTFSAYRFADVYRRVALGETISLAFLPIVVLGVYNIFIKDYKKWQMLYIGMILIAYTHLLSLMMTSIIVGIAGIVLLLKANNKKNRVKYFVIATFCSVLTASGVLVPILLINSLNDLKCPSGYASQFLENTDSIVTILINSIFNMPTAHGVGLMVFVIFVFNAVLISRDKNKKREKLVLFLSTISIVFIALTCSIVPWGTLANVPIVSQIQFPWRLNAYATLYAVLSLMVSFSSVEKEKSKKLFLITSCVLCVGLTFLSVLRLNKDVNSVLTDEYIIDNHEGNFDYTPSAYFYNFISTGEDLDENAYYLSNVRVDSSHYTSKSGTYQYSTIEGVTKDDVVEIPAHWYTTTHVLINDSEVQTWMSERGTVCFKSNADGNIKVTLFNRYSPIIYISWIISFVIFAYICVRYCVNIDKINAFLRIKNK